MSSAYLYFMTQRGLLHQMNFHQMRQPPFHICYSVQIVTDRTLFMIVPPFSLNIHSL